MFLCRWPNGDFSIVAASNKAHAIELLDEFANAEYAKLWKMPECLVNFRLDVLGDFELCDMGAATTEFIAEKCYPALEQVVTDAERDADTGEYTPAALDQIRAAVEHERTRQELPEPKQADTEIGRQLQRKMDMPSTLANRRVREVGTEILRSSKIDKGKVQ
jgi:hypothetical protein